MSRAALWLAALLWFSPAAHASPSDPPLLGDLTFGPTMTLIGFPSPLRVGVESRFIGLLGFSADFGFLPRVNLDDVFVQYKAWKVALKVFPFRSSFFLAIGFGRQYFDGDATNTINGTEVNYDIAIDTTIIVPYVGWQFGGTTGFFFSLEAGIQIAGATDVSFSSDATPALQATSSYKIVKKEVEDRGRTFGETPLPHFTLIQMGWRF